MTNVSRKYLIFHLDNRRFAFDLAQVAEIVEQPASWPIPMAPRYYAGAMNSHGTIVALMNLALFLGLPDNQATDKVIVLDTRIASLAFLVEKVIRIASVDHSAVREGAEGAYAVALLSLPDGDATVLDAAAIAERAGETING